MKKRKIGFLLLGIIGIAALIIFSFIKPISQDLAYHHFSDHSDLMGISNFWNVISNLPFLFVGLFGIFSLKKMNRKNIQFLTFFVGITLVAFGSGYYHWNPNNETLIWDRLPMTIAFTALLSILVSEFINFKTGKKLLIPFIILGLLSIIYWVLKDDLRPYVFIQFYPILSIPIILICFKTKNKTSKGFWLLLLAYLFAKVFETYDHFIHENLKYISGHTLKHISAAVGIFLLTLSYLKFEKKIV
ncbi:ceramidase domain-containing protein [Aureivirga sp. CE67]|uniref:ceramidase domain-containing protein n=1 Tax=Aureivirga sp. CE67 TaxID=1788983 RepID=UPI0018CAC5EB|nr:ceramidase domain-containing protein [Aureivirga sp. CE67]